MSYYQIFSPKFIESLAAVGQAIAKAALDFFAFQSKLNPLIFKSYDLTLEQFLYFEQKRARKARHLRRYQRAYARRAQKHA